MSDDISETYSPMRKLDGLNKEPQESTTHKNPQYTPQKLESNYMYK